MGTPFQPNEYDDQDTVCLTKEEYRDLVNVIEDSVRTIADQKMEIEKAALWAREMALMESMVIVRTSRDLLQAYSKIQDLLTKVQR